MNPARVVFLGPSSAHSAAGRPRRLRWRYLADLLGELVVREMKLLYKRSALGIAWTFINPLIQLSIFYFVFSKVLKIQVENYASFAFTGLTVWLWFMTSLVQATTVITGNKALIRQPGFPTPILPVVVLTTRLLHLLLALPILFGFLLVQRTGLTFHALYLPILLGIQFAFTLCLAYVLAALNVTLRDTGHILAVLLQLLMYLTPIFYSLQNVPEEYRKFYVINPMVFLLESYRDILVRGTSPDWAGLAAVALGALLLLPLGYRFFSRQKNRFVEEL